MECNCGGDSGSSRSSPYPMISVPSALQIVLDQVKIAIDAGMQSVQYLPLEKARGYAMAQSRHATEPFPPFPASTMDGYAVVSSDGPGSYPVVAESTAGPKSNGEFILSPGSICYITTGAPVPRGADAVIQVEKTEWVDPQVPSKGVKILEAVAPGTNIRPVGCDIRAGQTFVTAGEVLGPAEIGLLASMGISGAEVITPPRVGVMSTGDELVEKDVQSLQYGQIRDSNRATLLTAIEEAGGIPVDLGIVTDKEEELEKRMVDGLSKVDILMLSGGVSMGSLDLIKPLLHKLGTVHFGRLNMKPGKPTTFATIPVPHVDNGQKLVFALPGNPVSALVTFLLLAQPAIKAWKLGLDGITTKNHGYPTLKVKTKTDLKLDPERPEYHRVHVSWDEAADEWVGVSTGSQMSSRLLSLRSSNGLMLLPKGPGVINAGTILPTLLTGDWMKKNYAETALPSTKPPLPARTEQTHGAMATPPSSSSSSSSSSTTAPSTSSPPFQMRVAILTVSDRCFDGTAEDKSGPACKQIVESAKLKNTQCEVISQAIVCDDLEMIASKIKEWCDHTNPHPHLIITTGGTGFSPRDITPEAVTSVLERHASGFVYAMMQNSCTATPLGALSRPVAGTRKQTLIITLPGSPKAVNEILPPMMNLCPHAVKLLQAQNDPHPVNTAVKTANEK